MLHKFLFHLITLIILLYSFPSSGQSSTPKNNRINFEDFFGINSVRESDSSWLQDQYTVSNFHRIFGMDSYVFSGEEIVVNFSKNKFKVDTNIPHDTYPDDTYGFNPSKGAKGFNFDDFLLSLKQQGIKSIPVLAKNLLYTSVSDDNEVNVWSNPQDSGKDATDPMSYKAFSSFLFQFTARYGKNKLRNEGGNLDSSLLKLAINNEVRAGLDLVYAIEPGNEMNKDWFTDDENMSPKKMAAFLSAAIDGHMGLMGPGHGIRIADPTMKIVFPSPHDIDSEYILTVRNEFIRMREGAERKGFSNDFSNVILTAHYYPVKGTSQKNGKGGETVENSDIVVKSQEFIKRINSILPEMEIWLTESGYDKMTDPQKSRVAVPLSKNDRFTKGEPNELAQARNLTKLVLSMAEVGYDKMFVFTLKDPQYRGHPSYKSTFLSSGLCYKDGIKSLSWYTLNNLRQYLTGYTFIDAKSMSNLKIITFEKGEEQVLAIWTAEESQGNTRLKFDGSSIVKIVNLDAKEINIQDEKILKGILNLPVTDFPKLVFINKQRLLGN